MNFYIKAIEDENVKGAYNAVADEIPTQEDFMRNLAKAKNKIFIPVKVPSILPEIVLGEMSEILLEGTKISNEKIKNTGFTFQFTTVDEAFEVLL